jgi:hypothetical protein
VTGVPRPAGIFAMRVHSFHYLIHIFGKCAPQLAQHSAESFTHTHVRLRHEKNSLPLPKNFSSTNFLGRDTDLNSPGTEINTQDQKEGGPYQVSIKCVALHHDSGRATAISCE